MSRTRLTGILLIAVVAASTGCQRRASDEIDFGTVENSVYRNKYFGLSVTFPPDWSVQDRETTSQLMDTAAEVVAGDDRNIKAAVKASEKQTVNLLTVFQHPLGTPVPFNPSIVCVAERVRHLPGIKTGRDYLAHTKRLLEASQLQVFFPEEVSTNTLAGREFHTMHVNMFVAGVTIRQTYYAAIMKGYALGITVSSSSDEEAAALQEILDTMAFE